MAKTLAMMPAFRIRMLEFDFQLCSAELPTDAYLGNSGNGLSPWVSATLVGALGWLELVLVLATVDTS